MKRIAYYQRRGDAPSPVTSTPNTCGLLNYDGTKAANFDNATKMSLLKMAERCIVSVITLFLSPT